jgi:transcriptional regulator with XRE-family HTH domain
MVPLSHVRDGERGIRLRIDIAKLRRERLARGLTQEQLARAAGLTVATVCKIETGRQDPQGRTVIALERTLGVELAAEPATAFGRYNWHGWKSGAQ